MLLAKGDGDPLSSVFFPVIVSYYSSWTNIMLQHTVDRCNELQYVYALTLAMAAWKSAGVVIYTIRTTKPIHSKVVHGGMNSSHD